ncbi:MAG: GGDEF domain-containing protein [Candidatus Goldbacteria bacterium]|nr:GGDEF domain-containing protein [Candidatus Goldiibacteriota bacterium]
MNQKYKETFKKYRAEFVIGTLLMLAVFHSAYSLYQGRMSDYLNSFNYNVVLIAAGLVIIFTALFSYPRIYKFKMLLSGAVLSSFFINLLLVYNRPFKGVKVMDISLDLYEKAQLMPEGFGIKIMLLLLALNLLLVILATATTGFAAGRAWAVSVFVFNIAVYVLVLNVFPAFEKDSDSYFNTFNLLVLVLTMIFSILTIEEEHNFGSVIVSLAVTVFYLNMHADPYEKTLILAPVMGMILFLGMLAHWISCLFHMANYDPLLKIYNRQYMEGIVSGVADAKIGNKLAVMMIDIDHFKKINDTYGHAAGDVVLNRVASIIRETALPEGIVCRYGGEEIIVFLRDKTAAEAHARAEKIRKNVKKAVFNYKGKSIKATLSIGTAYSDSGLNAISAKIKQADDNVYKAKKAGRDRVVN